MASTLSFKILGLRLLLQTQLGRTGAHERRETVLPVDEGIPTDIYLPPRGNRRRGVILFIHGMAPKGYRDERLLLLAGVLANLGYIVVAPNLIEVCRFEVRRETIFRTAEIIKILARDRALTPNGRVALLAPSFSGALAVVAAGQKEVAPLVSSICTIGLPCDLVSSLDFFMQREDADPYGFLIVFKNYLRFSVGNREQLIEAFGVAAEDDGLRRTDGEKRLPAYLKTLSEKDRELFEELLRSKETRFHHWQTMRVRLAEEVKGMLPLDTLANIRANMTLIHGQDDNVIAPVESEKLFAEMRKKGIPGRLLITPLISHGDHSLTFGMIAHVFHLAGTFANFFRYI